MADDESIVRIKTEGDTSGAEKVEKAIEKTGAAAEKAAEKAALNTQRAANNAAVVTSESAKRAAGAWNMFAGTVHKCKSAIGAITGALGVVGFAIQGVQLIISAFQKLKEWLDRDKKAAEELARQIQDAKNKAAIEASAAAYEKLNAKVAETLRLEKERDRLADQKLGKQRAAEDAQTELEMQQELAGLDRNDPDYAEKAELVRSKYTRIRSKRAAERARADRITQQQRLTGLADEKENAAAEMEKDIYGKSGDAVISVRRQMMREKDPERLKSLDATLDRMIEQQQKKLAEVKKLRDEADSLRKEAVNLFGEEKAAQISDKATNVAQDAADADTRRQIEQNRKKREKDAAAAAKAKADAAAAVDADRRTVSGGKSEIAGLELNADAARAQAQAAAGAYEKEQGDVWAAQNLYDMLVVNGGSRKERSAALAALQREQAEAREAQRKMERVAAEVANTLQGINAQIEAISSAVRKAESRLAQNQTDAPEG